jgi:hypothetical protein
MYGSLLRVLPPLLVLALPPPATATPDGSRCQKTTARRLLALADAAQECMAACRDAAAAGSTRRCSAGSPDDALRRCLRRPLHKARARIRRACGGFDPPLAPFVRAVLGHETCGNGVRDEGEACDPLASPTGCDAGTWCSPECTCPAVCGDGVVTEPEVCDFRAPENGGCPEGTRCESWSCRRCECDVECGDGRIDCDEVCDPQASPSGCPAGEECLFCGACGRPAPLVSAEEDIVPCADSVGDRWTFEVEAGTIVTIALDTVDAASAANLGIEGTCPLTGFRAAGGAACTFAPPNVSADYFSPLHRACPRSSLVAPASGTCTLTVGVRDMDPGLNPPCSDPAVARYRVSVGGTTLTLVADDVSPGLVSNR